MIFKVSVIIPVFNRSMFIRTAAESANSLEETGEILIVDDGSTDDTLLICQQLCMEYPKVKLFQHNDKQNHGVSASRNLGIEKASFDFVAFLDSDDYYLPNRFDKDKEILLNFPDIDGVYSALGIHYYTEFGKNEFYNAGFKYQEFLTVSEIIPPEELFFVLFNTHPLYKGDFSTVTITVRKKIFDTVGVFNINLKQKEDIHLWRRMAAKCRLASGNIISPVAIRGVHDNNTMLNNNIQPNAGEIWWPDLYKWLNKEKVKKEYLTCFNLSYLYYKIKVFPKHKSIPAFFYFFFLHTSYIKLKYDHFDNYFFELFGRKRFATRFISIKNRLFNS